MKLKIFLLLCSIVLILATGGPESSLDSLSDVLSDSSTDIEIEICAFPCGSTLCCSSELPKCCGGKYCCAINYFCCGEGTCCREGSLCFLGSTCLG